MVRGDFVNYFECIQKDGICAGTNCIFGFMVGPYTFLLCFCFGFMLCLT